MEKFIIVTNASGGMFMNNEKTQISVTGLVIGVIASLLVLLGNPTNMGFCIACFLRDTAGGLSMQKAAVVQYIRPEIIGLVLGSFLLSIIRKEFKPRGGSSPISRFVIGFFVMIGCLMFLGCPFRTVLRLAGGDLNAIFGLVGFIAGICLGIVFLKKGYSLGRTYTQKPIEGAIFPLGQIFLLFLLVFFSGIFAFSESGPGSQHAPLFISLVAGLLVGALSQKTRMCMVGGVRDVVLFREWKLLIGYICVFIGALITNVILNAVIPDKTFFKLGFEGQAIAHTDGLWNFLGMALAGFGAVLLGGCPLRQLVLAGEGNSDSAITVLGLMVGAAFAHNFGLASSGAGPTAHGQIAVVFGFVIVGAIAAANTFCKKGGK